MNARAAPSRFRLLAGVSVVVLHGAVVWLLLHADSRAPTVVAVPTVVVHIQPERPKNDTPPPPEIRLRPPPIRPPPMPEVQIQIPPSPRAITVPPPQPLAELKAAPVQAAGKGPGGEGLTVGQAPPPPDYAAKLLSHLAAYKEYPYAARMRRQQGVVNLRFTMDREGNVLSSAIAKSSGSKALDDEALALIVRAQPLPPPPAGYGGAMLTLVVPIVFSLR